MLKKYGILFHQASGQLTAIVGGLPERDDKLTQTDSAAIFVFVRDTFLPLLEEFELRHTLAETGRFSQMMHDGNVSYRKAKEFLRGIARRFADELEEIHFLYVAYPGNYTNSTDGWEDVVAKFSALTFDIDEAEKCIALNRYTAAVFHLMRVVEAGVQELGNRLGVKNPAEKQWGDISNEIKQQIDKLPDANPMDKAYKTAMHDVKAHLDHVRWAWRNPTMHPKQTYTAEEAFDVLDKVRTFMTRLVAVI